MVVKTCDLPSVKFGISGLFVDVFPIPTGILTSGSMLVFEGVSSTHTETYAKQSQHLVLGQT